MNTNEAIGHYKSIMAAMAAADAEYLPELNFPRAHLTSAGEAAVLAFNSDAFGEEASLNGTACYTEAEDQAENLLREEMAVVEIPSTRSKDRQTHLLHLDPDWFTWS